MAEGLEAIVYDLPAFISLDQGRDEKPSAGILDGRTMQSSPESGAQAGCDGVEKKKGSKMRLPVYTITAVDEQSRQIRSIATEVNDSFIYTIFVP